MATSSKSLRYRNVMVDGIEHRAPSGVARNNRNKCWQVKVEKNGRVELNGNYTDWFYGSSEKSLAAATKEMLAKLEVIEELIEDEESEITNESWQLTTRSSLIKQVTPGKTIYQIAVYDKEAKKARLVYIGTANTVIKTPGVVIDKIAKAISLDMYFENGGSYNWFARDFSHTQISVEIVNKARQLYDEHMSLSRRSKLA